MTDSHLYIEGRYANSELLHLTVLPPEREEDVTIP